MRAIKWLDRHFEECILAALLAVIACVSLIQVIVQNIPSAPSLTWAEEFCRFCWVWSVFLSLPYTIRTGSMLRVTALLELMPRRAREVVNLMVDLITAVSMGFLAVCSVAVVGGIKNSGETSPAMLWPMWIVYGVMLLGFALAAFRSLQQLLRRLRHFGETAPPAVTGDAEAAGKRPEGGEG